MRGKKIVETMETREMLKLAIKTIRLLIDAIGHGSGEFQAQCAGDGTGGGCGDTCKAHSAEHRAREVIQAIDEQKALETVIKDYRAPVGLSEEEKNQVYETLHLLHTQRVWSLKRIIEKKKTPDRTFGMSHLAEVEKEK